MAKQLPFKQLTLVRFQVGAPEVLCVIASQNGTPPRIAGRLNGKPRNAGLLSSCPPAGGSIPSGSTSIKFSGILRADSAARSAAELAGKISFLRGKIFINFLVT